jgi:hypothetical protein
MHSSRSFTNALSQDMGWQRQRLCSVRTYRIQRKSIPTIPSSLAVGQAPLASSCLAKRLKFATESGEVLSPHELGVLWLKGANILAGYLNQRKKPPKFSATAGFKPETWRGSTKMASCTSKDRYHSSLRLGKSSGQRNE